MTGKPRYSRWRWIGLLAGLAALVGIWRTAIVADRGIRTAAAAAAARGAAGYLTLVVPADSSGAYDQRRLLSNAALLASADFWRAGLQVSSGLTPLLPEPDPEVAAAAGARRLAAAGAAPATFRRNSGATAVIVPLSGPDLQRVRGTVEVWDAIPPGGVPFVRVALTIVVLLALALSGRMGAPGRASAERRLAWLIPSGAVAVFTLVSALAVEQTAAAATDASLERARRLAEVAAVSHRRTPEELARVAPGIVIDFPDSVSRDRGVRTRSIEGAIEATATGILNGNRPISFAMVPFGAQLDRTWIAFAGWVLLLFGGVGFSVWAEGASLDRRRFRRVLGALAFAAPAGLHLALFSAGPLLLLLWLALHRWGAADAARPFVGLSNFAAVLGDSSFWHSMALTGLYALYVPVTLALALAAALQLHRAGTRLRAVFGVAALPLVVSGSAAALAWQGVFRAGTGPVARILALAHLPAPDWLSDPRTALVALMAIGVWTHFGYQVVLFVAGLRRIPAAYFDAAELDGAGAWNRLIHVTLPLLRPTILFVVVTGTVAALQAFTAVSVLTGGGPGGATELAVPRIYREGWDALHFGAAGAMSIVLALIVGVLVWLEFRWLGGARREA